MGSINPVNDPLDNDSMDPNDPTSIMYDPTLAEKNGTVIVGPNGQVVVVPPNVDDKDSDSSDLSSPVASPDSTVQGVGQADNDITRKLRRFGKL